MVPAGMTPRQFDVLRFVETYVAKHGYSPSFKEIGKGVGLASTSAVHRLVHALEARGQIALRQNSPRSIAAKRGVKLLRSGDRTAIPIGKR